MAGCLLTREAAILKPTNTRYVFLHDVHEPVLLLK